MYLGIDELEKLFIWGASRFEGYAAIFREAY